jgi:hypothetical protein
MWPYGAVQAPLGQLKPTYADRLNAHWRALPRWRKWRVLFYLAWRLVRAAKNGLASGAEIVRRAALAACRSFKQGVVEVTVVGAKDVGDLLNAIRSVEITRSDVVALYRSARQEVVEFGAVVVQECEIFFNAPNRTRRVAGAATDVAVFTICAAWIFHVMAVVAGGFEAARNRADAHRMTVVEAAHLAKHMRPNPCYFADGSVWIDDNGTLVRPGDDNYRRLLHDVCDS